MTALEIAERQAWHDLAEACLLHDAEHEACAIADLRRLHQIPEPRESS